MLEAKNLSKNYGHYTALSQLNLSIEAGEVFCLLGANGAGKTTTIHLFLNFIEPSEGEARVNGRSVVEAPQLARAELAYIPERVNVYDQLTGVENLDFFAQLGGQRHGRRELLDYLSQVGLPARAADQRVATYSKGMRQKVCLAIALAKQARALLLDEPTSGLDPKAANEFIQLLGDLAERGVAILMATHDLFRAREVGHRVGIMKQGQLLETVPTSSISATDLEKLYLQHMHD